MKELGGFVCPFCGGIYNNFYKEKLLKAEK